MTLQLDFLSPLPPVRSGIADYAVDLLPHLVELCDVRVLRLPELPLDEEVSARFAIAAGAERAGESGRIPLYQMGNNRYHAAVWATAMERPGVLVLHDLVLHHFLLDRTVGRGEWEPYRDELARCHGWIGDAAARPVRWGAFGRAAQFELAANGTLAARQRGVLVHGRWAAERLQEEDPRLAVRVVPMGIPLPATASRAAGLAFRRRIGVPEAAPLLGSFGFQTPIKRTDVAIRALARPELAAAHLLVAGELSPYANLVELAKRLGVDHRVHVTGFLPFAELEAAIAAADLCLNLRYPSAGETSASLLRILAVGRPVVVSEYAELGDLPREVALPVPLGEDEVERFAGTVAATLAAGAGALAAMGERARRHVAEGHDPRRAAEAVATAVAELARLEPPGERTPSPPPRSSNATGRPRGAIRADGLDGWRPGERRTVAVEVHNQGPGLWLPSVEAPGGVIFEVQIGHGEADDAWLPGPWLRLESPLPPGERVVLPLTLRRPLAPTRLIVKPRVAIGEGYRDFGDWRLDRWL